MHISRLKSSGTTETVISHHHQKIKGNRKKFSISFVKTKLISYDTSVYKYALSICILEIFEQGFEYAYQNLN